MTYTTNEIQPTFSFPKLMVNTSSNEVVLFSEVGKGTILVSTDPTRLAKVLANVTMTPFEDYFAIVTVENISE